MRYNEFLGPDGPLAQAIDGYETRREQIEFVRAVDKSIADGTHLLAECPTGSGKTFGYSIPAIMHAVKREKRAVIVTSTINLQEQVVAKDLPTLQRSLPVDFKFELVKGRSNYVCLKEFQNKKRGVDKSWGSGLVQQFDQVEEWARVTGTGDVSELEFTPHFAVWGKFSTSSDYCLGKKCFESDACWVTRARNRAYSADVIVTNYHLYLTDAMIKMISAGQGGILPPHRVVILDEAHRLVDISRSVLGWQVTPMGIFRAIQQLPAAGNDKLGGYIRKATDNFFDNLTSHYDSNVYKIRLRRENEVAGGNIASLLHDAAEVYSDAIPGGRTNDIKAKWDRCRIVCRNAAGHIVDATNFKHPEDVVYYIDRQPLRTALASMPIKVDQHLRNAMFGQDDLTVIATSATLTTGGRFKHFRADAGIDDADEMVVKSPFDVESNCLLVVPEMPAPNSDEFRRAVIEKIRRAVQLAGGRTLCLFTSYRNLNAVHDALRGEVKYLLKQGDMPRTKMVEEFRRVEESVLLGTDSFWAGVDVPGQSLSCIVIDRLPFATPADPVLDAIKGRGENWFRDYSLPRAVIQFKQGFGRLIRTVHDRGVVVVLDKRIAEQRAYKEDFLLSIPNVRKSRDIEDVGTFLDGEIVGSPYAF